MNKQEYKQYLRSEHWKNLRAAKRSRARKTADGSPRCAIRASTERIETHHLQYRDIYDVVTSDLRLLCRRCHQTAHDLLAAGLKLRSPSHHGMFCVLKEKVKKELGLTGRNLFAEASRQAEEQPE